MCRRVGQMVLALWLAFTLSFLLFQILPSDPVQIMIGPENPVSAGEREALRAELGLDKPDVVRYFISLAGAIHGDLGYSYRSGRSVTSMIATALGPTSEVALLALGLAVPFGVAVAVAVALSRNQWLREVLLAWPPIAQSVPSFWLGLTLVQVFAFGLRLLPPGGSGSWPAAILPAVTIAVPAAALLAQTLAVRLLHESAEPYATAAVARGYRPWRVTLRHLLRNSLAPTLSMAGMLVGWLFSGAVVVETVFARDGVGRLVQNAVNTQDLPVLQGVVLFSTFVFVAVSAAVDVLQRLVDPRMRDASSVRVVVPA